jgi:hypothetical protein
MELESAARRVDDVGVELVEVANRLKSLSPSETGFGAGGSGAFGELGRALAGQVSGAVSARAAEATALAAAASALSATVVRATSAYREVDDRRGRPTSAGGA